MNITYKDIPSAPVTYADTKDIGTGDWRVQRPVLDISKCTRCYICWEYCPDVSMVVGSAGDYPAVDLYHCKGCGICSNECPKGAIKMEREPD